MTAIRRNRYVPLQYLRPGTQLPPRRTWDPAAPGQVVVKVDFAGNFPKVTVRDEATGEEYSRSCDPKKGFPCPETRTNADVQDLPGRIPESTNIDWSMMPRNPIADELQEGDVLPPKDERHTSDMFKQRLSRVSLNHQGMLQLYLQSGGTIFAPVFALNEEIEFPTDMRTFRERRRTGATSDEVVDRMIKRAEVLANLETLGYYRHKESGTIYRFVRHPFGRGAWPNEIPTYHEARRSPDGGPVISQPPRAAHAPNTYAFLAKLSPDEAAELEERWGVPQPLVNPPRGCNLDGTRANDHPQPRTAPKTTATTGT